MLKAIPVTILTGFLGSGKTTLINHYLKQNRDEKLVVIENEFGPINLDSQLLSNQTSLNIVELTNGCICCTVQGELTTALHQLFNDRLSQKIQFDRLIIETTGLADPAPIIQTFFIDEMLKNCFKLDGIVTLADCEHILTQIEEHPVALSQIGFADRIILTKIERISESQLEDISTKLKTINQKAELISSTSDGIPSNIWLDIDAFDLDEHLTISKSLIRFNPLDHQSERISLKQSAVTIKQNHSNTIRSAVLYANELDIKKAGAFMEKLIDQYGHDLLRYKGIFAIKDESRKLIVQGVHKIVGFDYGSNWLPMDEKRSILVIIGRNIPFKEIETQFTSL